MSQTAFTKWGSLKIWGVIVAVVLPTAGCGHKAEVVLHQSFAPSSQQRLELAADWAYHAPDAGRWACLLAFPLPGATDGPWDFVIYVSAPDRLGRLHVYPADPDAVQGFLIQEVGVLSGQTCFAGGTVEVGRPWLARSQRKLKLDVRCDDGTLIRGQAVVELAPDELSAFHRAHAADIELIQPDSGSGAGRGRGARSSSLP